MSEQVKGIPERAPEPPYMDFPEAWAFVRTTKLEDHHMRCSWRSGVLCDCNVLWAEYYKRKAARSEQALADQYHAASQFADAIVRMDAEKVKHEQALAALEARNKELESALERIASDFETDFVIDGQVVDEPYKTHEWAWRAARAALKGAS